jgi:hypothetical protein
MHFAGIGRFFKCREVLKWNTLSLEFGQNIATAEPFQNRKSIA